MFILYRINLRTLNCGTDPFAETIDRISGMFGRVNLVGVAPFWNLVPKGIECRDVGSESRVVDIKSFIKQRRLVQLKNVDLRLVPESTRVTGTELIGRSSITMFDHIGKKPKLVYLWPTAQSFDVEMMKDEHLLDLHQPNAERSEVDIE